MTDLKKFELQNVFGGLDWQRTGRAYQDGASLSRNVGLTVGEVYGGTPGKVVGGILGGFAAPFFGGWTAALDAGYQRDGKPDQTHGGSR